MKVLGIESTAHTFGVGIIDEKGFVYSNIREILTTKTGGIHPMKACEHHTKHSIKIISKTLTEANMTMNDINIISYSASPGLGPTLKIGCFVARTLALKFKKPLIAVNHCIAHLEIAKLQSKFRDPLMLYASGVNTQIITYKCKAYQIIGETLDLGIGNFLDKLARYMNLGFPGGPKIEKIAQSGKNFIELPYSIKGMDISFAGLFTHTKRLIDEKKYAIEDICYSVQETAFAMLVEATERALSQTEKKELVLGGGVSCNKRLQEMCKIMCSARDSVFFVPNNEFLVDNGAMIAWLGILKATKKEFIDPLKAEYSPYIRTDQIKISWR